MAHAGQKARSLGSYLPGVTRKALERFGFPAAELLTSWSTIVGPELAAYTGPDKLLWPTKATSGAENEAARSGARLVLRVEGPRVLELQHRKEQVIERINRHFGFRAVAELKLVQAPIRPSGRPGRPALKKQAARQRIDSTLVPDDRLRDALERLAGNVAANHRK
jgi:hypothetical protein